MGFFNNLIAFIGMIGGIAVLAKTIHYFSASKFTKEVKKYEIFKEVKNLIEEDEQVNFPIISMGIQCLSKREMTLEEIKWFIYTTNASKYLKTYSEQYAYIEISKDRKSFVYKEEFNSRRARFLGLSKFLCIYAVLAGFGFNLIANNLKDSKLEISIIYGSISLTSIVFGLFFLWKFFTLLDARKLLRHNFSSRFKDDVKFIL